MKRGTFPIVAAVLTATTALLLLLCLVGRARSEIPRPALAASLGSASRVTSVGPTSVLVEQPNVGPDLVQMDDSVLDWGEPRLAGYWNFHMLSDGQGGVYVAWSSGTGNVPSEQPPYLGQTYVQHYNGNGDRLWGTQDILLSDTGRRESVVALLDDGAGGAIVVWVVDDGFDGVYSDLRAQRLSSSGVPLWQAGGVPIVTDVPYLDWGKAIPDEQGGVLVTWSRCENPDIAARCQVWAQRILAAGTRAWATGGEPLSFVLDNEELDVCWAQPDSLGGGYIVWEETRDGNTLALVQHVDGQGSVHWAGDAHSFPFCIADGGQADALRVIGLKHSHSTHHLDVYLLNLQTGTTEPKWEPVTVETDSEWPGGLTSDGAGGVFVSWTGKEYSYGDNYHWVALVQHIDAQGEVLWDQDVRLGRCGSGYYSFATIIPDDHAGAYAAWAWDDDVRMQHVDANGQILWPEGGIAVVQEAHSPRLQPDGAGGAFLAWTTGPDYWWEGHEQDYPFYLQSGFTHLHDPVHGQVLDGFGDPVPDAQVTLRRGGTTVMTTTTDTRGFYRFSEAITDTNLSVRVTLQESTRVTPTFQIRYGLYNDPDKRPVVYAETTPFTPTTSSACVRDVDFGKTPLLSTDVHIMKDHLDDLATIYYHTWQAAQLATRHGITLDHHLPVDVYAYMVQDGGNVQKRCYWRGPMTGGANAGVDPYIVLGWNESGYGSGDRPGNREWHEFGHHVMGDVFDNRMPQSPSADINHGGYHSNTTTVDSWVEGWAEFWSLMVADEISGTAKPEIYPVGASRINMEENRKAWQLWGGKAYEELAVASALWDLYDGKDEKDKDNIDMTTDQVLDILASNYYTDLNPTNVPTGGLPYGYPFDVLTIYSATISHTLKYGYTVTDVNHVFREHGLCYDKNNNQKCDDGERVGQSTNSGRPNRRNQPTVEGSYVAYTASDVDAGTPLTITDFLVSVAYAPPFEDYSYAYTTHAEQDTPGLLYSVAPSPEYAATVIITPLLSLYRSLDPLTYSTEFYWAEMDLLPTASFIEHAFVLERVYPAYLPIVLKSH